MIDRQGLGAVLGRVYGVIEAEPPSAAKEAAKYGIDRAQTMVLTRTGGGITTLQDFADFAREQARHLALRPSADPDRHLDEVDRILLAAFRSV
jgi:hypothetical protein